ncbi:PQQ-binding-like beta-propeller repeat protein [bacterium]|nr:PQQ-binding-like beta-propeller repeat protein [bacterium]
MKYFTWIIVAAIFASCGTSGSIGIGRYYRKTQTESWANMGGNAGRTGFRNTPIQPPLELAWKISVSSAVNEAIAAKDSIIYFGTLDGRMYAVWMSNGKIIGRIRYTHPSSAGMCLTGNSAVYGLSNGKNTLIAYNLMERKHTYAKDLGAIESNPLVADDYIYVGSQNKNFYCVNLSDGSVKWKYSLKKPTKSSPSVHTVNVFFGCDDGTVYSLNRYTGQLNWAFKADGPVQSAPVIDDPYVFVGTTDGNFYALNLSDGSVKWQFKVENPLPGNIFASASTDNNRVYVGSTNGYLYALNKNDGAVDWQFKTNGVISTAPLVTPTYVFVGSQDKVFYAINSTTGLAEWQYKTNGRIKTNPARLGDYIFIAAENNNVFAFRPAGLGMK